MEIRHMREYIARHPKYKNSPNWRARVMNMPTNQVVAIYNSFQKLNYRKIEKQLKRQEKDNKNYHQINMFEYLESIKED